MKLYSVLSIILPAVTLNMAQSAFADGPPVNEVWIENLVTGGDGCPSGTVTESISDDRQAFTLIFDEFYAEVYDGRTMDTNFCQINMTLHVPQGWQYSLATFDYRGYAYLEEGVAASQRASYYFTGDGATTNFMTFIEHDGYDFDDLYQVSDTIGMQSVVWSPCGGSQRALNVKVRLELFNKYHPILNPDAYHRRRNKDGVKGAYGFMSTDSVDGSIEQVMRLGLWWQPC